MYGGWDRSPSKSHATPAKNGWTQTLSVPPAKPSHFVGSLSRNLVVRLVSFGQRYCESAENSSPGAAHCGTSPSGSVPGVFPYIIL
uniref:Uncharacterized protein n=1 Tax=Oryza sativa subsp. japonica TaxID=39947 RepID=Q6Z0H3_ORYSJ|nr:hypothetical protein [Oryza sativa Japonica Group]BAD03633.1 hypothetical protein [Oryza sativa Japonica Group]